MTHTTADRESPGLAPASASEVRLVQVAQSRESREDRPERANFGSPSGQMSPASGQPHRHRMKNFPAGHPPATLRSARFHAPEESESGRKNRGQQVAQHPDWRQPRHSLAGPSERHAAPVSEQFSIPGQKAAAI